MNTSKSGQRKLLRKHRKAQHTLEKQSGIGCSKTATKYLAVCNAGHLSGLTREKLMETFLPHGQIEDIIIVPGETYCFVKYYELKSAIEAFETLNGKANIAQYEKPIYLCYVKTAPKCIETALPPGLTLLEDFVSEDEETMLLEHIDFAETSASLKHRQVKHYGYEFCYDINNVDKNKPLPNKIPEEYTFIFERLHENLSILFIPDQLTVNRYLPGQGIPPHIDTHSAFEDPIISLSLGCDIIMDFKNEGTHIPVFLKRRSLLIMSEDSRYVWTHGITPRKSDIVSSENGLTVLERGVRTSFTFRRVLRAECACIYTSKCDSYQQRKKKSQIDDAVAAKLEATHVHSVYERIASHFSDTRHKPWPNVLAFVDTLEAGSVLVDIGCGNGKYFGFNKNIFEIGCDRSSNLAEVCQSKGFSVFTCDCLSVPIRDGTADAVISIAVIHHLANHERRKRAVQEMARILRTSGKALIYVWAKDQQKDSRKSSYLKQNRKNRKDGNTVTEPAMEEINTGSISLPVHVNRTQFRSQDMLVPWKMKETYENSDLFLRFYHIFEEGELESLCSEIENIRILKSYYDQGNWCVIFEKL